LEDLGVHVTHNYTSFPTFFSRQSESVGQNQREKVRKPFGRVMWKMYGRREQAERIFTYENKNTVVERSSPLHERERDGDRETATKRLDVERKGNLMGGLQLEKQQWCRRKQSNGERDYTGKKGRSGIMEVIRETPKP